MSDQLKFELLPETPNELNDRCLGLLKSFHDISRVKAGSGVLSMSEDTIRLSYNGDVLLLEKNKLNYYFRRENGEIKVFINKKAVDIDGEIVTLLEDVKSHFDNRDNNIVATIDQNQSTFSDILPAN